MRGSFLQNGSVKAFRKSKLPWANPRVGVDAVTDANGFGGELEKRCEEHQWQDRGEIYGLGATGCVRVQADAKCR